MKLGRATTRSGGRVARWAGFAGALVVALVALLVPVGRASAAAEVRVTVGVDGRYEVGDHLVVGVTVTADELIDGEIVLTIRDRDISTRRDVQIAAGTTKEYYFALPSSWEEPTIEVSVRDRGDEVATASTRARQRTGGEVVGVLPRLAARAGELPADLPLGDDLGLATVAAVPLAAIDLGPGALRTFDSIAAGADDIAELSDDQRATLFAWVSLGGILMLDDDAAVGDLPDAWAPGPNGYAWADLGEVRLTGGEAVAGHWDRIIQLTVLGSPAMSGGTEMMMDPQQDLAGRAGLDLPSITPLVIGIALYALVLGPVVYFVLRRMRRLTLGWLVVPLLAVLTAGGVAVAGGGALRNGNPATATFVQESPAGSYALSNVLTFSDSGGRANVDIPAGWGLGSSDMFWGGGRPVPIEIIRNGDGSAEAAVSLEATQANVRMYAGTARRRGLSTTAQWDGDRTINGAVTNDSDVTLHDVAVFGGEDETLVGDIAAGESVEWSITAARNLRFAWETRGTAVWGDPFGVAVAVAVADGGPAAVDQEDDADAGSLVEFGIWGASSSDIELFPTGMVRVVGWTTEVPSDLVADEDASTTTALSSLMPITSDGDSVGAPTIRVSAVRSPFLGVGAGNDQVIRFVLPALADPDELFLVGHDDVGIEELAFWNGRDWIDADASVDVIEVPEAARRDGVLLVRTDVDMNRGPVGMPTLVDERPEDS